MILWRVLYVDRKSHKGTLLRVELKLTTDITNNHITWWLSQRKDNFPSISVYHYPSGDKSLTIHWSPTWSQSILSVKAWYQLVFNFPFDILESSSCNLRVKMQMRWILTRDVSISISPMWTVSCLFQKLQLLSHISISNYWFLPSRDKTSWTLIDTFYLWKTCKISEQLWLTYTMTFKY